MNYAKIFDLWCLFYSDIEQYILHGDEIYAVLNRLVNHKKKLFLITNSPFSFVWVSLLHIEGLPHKSCVCSAVFPVSIWKLHARVFCGNSDDCFLGTVCGERCTPQFSLHYWLSLFEEDTRLWLATTLQSCHFGLSLAAFAASQTSLVFQLYRRKGGTAWNSQRTTSILHAMRQPWGIHKSLCFLPCYWNESEFRTDCCKDAMLGQKEYWIC